MKLARVGVLGALALALAGLLVAVGLLAGSGEERATPETTPSPAPGPATGPATGPTTGAPASRPNVVVVMADDMRVDDLRYAPQVRRLIAQQGLEFENSFSPFPLCCPARASFLSGQYAHNHEVYWHEPPYGYAAFDDSRSLATSFRDAGYRTGMIGKYLNRYGLDLSKVSGKPSHTYVPRGWDDWRAAVENPGDYGFHGNTYNYMDTPFNVNGVIDNGYTGVYQTGVIGDFSVDMARSFAETERPFFMYVNYVAPHFGGPAEADDPPKMLDDAGNDREFKTPARPDWVKGRFDDLIDRSGGMPADGGPSEADVSDKPDYYRDQPDLNAQERDGLRTLTRQRAEAVFAMDRQVARLVRELKDSGAWEDTVLVFTSDNGYYLGEHRVRTGKVRPHEPSFRVPLLVTGPGMRSGEKRYDPISTVDLTATLLDLAGAEPPRAPDGISRLPSMLSGDRGWTTPVMYEATHTANTRTRTKGFSDPRSAIGVRTPRYSYVRTRGGQNELYDLLRDPLENENLIARPGHHRLKTMLYDLWWEVRNCADDGCRIPLPPALQTTPEETAQLTRAYWRRIDQVYGF